jgi:hypothetical protein
MKTYLVTTTESQFNVSATSRDAAQRVALDLLENWGLSHERIVSIAAGRAIG